MKAPRWAVLGCCLLLQFSAGAAERKANRLAGERSPYLKAHGFNLVDWFPWGAEAFEKARREQLPIFLSIGFSTCSWCHQMAQESFMDAAVARLMNRSFVNIKVDREERPEIDQVYMSFLEASTGLSGWPLSAFLTPDLQPFFATGYLPRDRLLRQLEIISRSWNRDRKAVLESAGKVESLLRDLHVVAETDTSGGQFRVRQQQLYEHLLGSFDSRHGGFGRPPRFPPWQESLFLLRYQHLSGKPAAGRMVQQTLRTLASSPLRDQLDGGFHRLTKDSAWTDPQFEKVLFLQAEAARAYTEAWQATGDPRFREVALGVFDYVLDRLQTPEGLFRSAEEAASPCPGRPEQRCEGDYYLWSRQDFDGALGADAEFGRSWFLDWRGTDPAIREAGAKRPLSSPLDPLAWWSNLGRKPRTGVSDDGSTSSGQSPETHSSIEADRLNQRIEELKFRLRRWREDRPAPFFDDKSVTAWNGMMISALAYGSSCFRDPQLVEQAKRAAEAVIKRLLDPSTGELYRIWKDGSAGVPGFLDDYAFLVEGLLDLYEASLEGRFLVLALELKEKQIELFWDEENGGFFNSPGRDPTELIRLKELYAGAEPSPNSTAVANLMRLAGLSGREDLKEKALRTVAVFDQRMEKAAGSMPRMGSALGYLLRKPLQVVIAGQFGASDTQALLEVVHRSYLPYRILLLADSGPAHLKLAETAPNLGFIRPMAESATAFVCEDFVCKLPTTDPGELAKQLTAALYPETVTR